jgi:hypothetical protein
METDWEDDWESTEIPDLLISIQNKERELKLLEERKLMEDADLALAEELFNDEQEQKKVESFVPVKLIKKEKPKDLQILQEQKRKELQEKQKQQSQKQKEKKLQKKKQEELFGEAEFDEYDEMYGHIEDQY